MFKRLLVPLDGSRLSSRAIVYATEVARHFGAEITLLHVVHPTTPVPVTTGMVPGDTEITIQAALEADKKNVSSAKRYLRGKVRSIRNTGLSGSYEVIRGNPTQSILDFAKKYKIDLVIMTTHGKGGLKRVIMGSVADRIIRESGKPVLVVRPQKNRSYWLRSD
jgi:nucleotide-binding universal stress UspA family protein